jgi:hypothetical protein
MRDVMNENVTKVRSNPISDVTDLRMKTQGMLAIKLAMYDKLVEMQGILTSLRKIYPPVIFGSKRNPNEGCGLWVRIPPNPLI